jgi:trans-aconitate 2-methyltransferase
MPNWDQELYYRFRQQRTQPSIDLVARIPLSQPVRVVDLGCGAGNSTAELRRRWPDCSLVGIDNSDEMLTAARQTDPRTQWVKADIASWQPEEPYELVFSNAALQWLPDHETLIPRLLAAVRPDGLLAVQLPDHYDSALYRVLIEVSFDLRWTARLEPARHSLTRHNVSFYYDLLSSCCQRFDIWTTEYHHELSSHQEILTFHRGTGMRPYLEALSADEIEDFEQLVLDGYRQAFPLQANGRVLFPFKRLFFIAYG